METNKFITKQILKGSAPVPNNQQSVNISGGIDSVSNYLSSVKSKLSAFDPLYSIVLVDSSSIKFKGTLNFEFGVTVNGSIVRNKIISQLGINEDKMYIPKDLEKKLRFLKHYFKNDSEYLDTISRLKQVSIKTKGIVESENSTNKSKELKERVHDFNPITFNININLFEGYRKRYTFPVVIYADVTDAGAKLWLEAIDLDSICDKISIEKIESELKLISEFGFPIINC